MAVGKVYIGNISESCEKGDVESRFGKYGTIRSVWIARK